MLLWMIGYFDEIFGSDGRFPEFQARKRELNESLLKIADSYDDEAHRSGEADYIVRVTTPRWSRESLPTPNAFLIIESENQVVILEKVDSGTLQTTAEFAAEDWFERICDEFRDFRERLGQ